MVVVSWGIWQKTDVLNFTFQECSLITFIIVLTKYLNNTNYGRKVFGMYFEKIVNWGGKGMVPNHEVGGHIAPKVWHH